MQAVGLALQVIGSLGILVCLIMVIMKMFQNGQTGLGIATAILSFCGIGFLIAFIYGWVKSGQWNLRNVMLIWTACIVLEIIANLIAPPSVPAGFGQ
jgi:hypothetical protein